jgi:transcriptional regulator with XRE-family HTH domain
MSSFGDRLYEARRKSGLSQEAFSDKLGVSRQMISKWELGTATPRTSRMKKICETLQISCDELVTGKKLDLDNKSKVANYRPVAHKSSIFEMLLKGVAVIILFLIVFYLGYSCYKLVVLTNISNKVSKYESLNNYYCKIDNYGDNGIKETKSIWYKDGIYKIETITANGENVATKFVNCNENKRYEYNNETKEYEEFKLSEINKGIYENGHFMYSLFPIVFNKEETNIGKYAFKLGSISIYTENNIVFIEVEDKLIQLDSETYLPISQSLIGKKNNMSIVDNRVVYYNVELNCVTDEEINMDR